MTIGHHGHEHEFEPQHGLPERLPGDERIVWQGAPDPGVLARRAFHLRKLALYFGLLLMSLFSTRRPALLGRPAEKNEARSRYEVS